MTGPWDFDEARENAKRASLAQRGAEQFIKDAYREYAMKEEAYRLALAQKITELHAQGVAWSSTSDLARGEQFVARLKRDRDIAEGVVEAAKQAGWRASKDRDDCQAFIEWSRRREFAEAAA